MIKKHLEAEGVFTKSTLPQITTLTSCVTNIVDSDMLKSIAVSEIILLTSQFRRYLPDPKPGSKGHIPINSISFVLSGSGSSKDSTVKQMRDALKPGYELINNARTSLARQKAIRAATSAGDENPADQAVYKKYYREPSPIFTRLTNDAAYMEHLADTEALEIGAGFLMSSETGSEMETNPHLIPIIRVLSEMYDGGDAKVQILRDKTRQTPEIKQLAVSALFMGSQKNILFDEKIKTIFKKEFTTKLARRTFFTYCPTDPLRPESGSMKELRAARKLRDAACVAAQESISANIAEIAKYNLSKKGIHLTISDEARELYHDYMDYNSELAETIQERYPITKLVRKHAHWRAYKMAGAMALMDMSDEIQKKHMIYAITYVEDIEDHMRQFEVELVKEPYEVFSDYMRSRAEDNKASITLHALKKLEYIKGTGSTTTKMQDLVKLASSFDPNGIYSVRDNTIEYELIVKTDRIGASFLAVSGTKEQRAKNCATGYEYAESDFPALANLLKLNLAYTPFQLKNGIRGRDNIIGGTKWLVFDIDNSIMTGEEVHLMLEDINHHIALTSDDNNQYKFRVIVELDAPVTVDSKVWSIFVTSVAEYLNLTQDPVPQSQIYFGYEGRTVWSVTNKQPIEIKDHVQYAVSESQERTPVKEYTAKEKSALLSTPFDTFAAAFEAENGEGSRRLYGAAYKANKLGMSKPDIKNLIDEISDYWVSPFPQHRLDALKQQIDRF